MSKIKTFFTDSQPGCVLKISVNLSLNVLIKNILMKKKRVQSETRTRNYFIDINCTNLLNKHSQFHLVVLSPTTKREMEKLWL